MARLFRRIAALLSVILIVTFAAYSAYKNMVLNLSHFPPDQYGIDNELSPSERAPVERSRQSAVRIMSADIAGEMVSSASGTYIKYGEKHYILTVNHAIVGPCILTKIVVDGYLYDCIRYVLSDHLTDYLIMEVQEIPNRIAVVVPGLVPADSQWLNSLAILKEVVYTGYPNGLGPLTFRGTIVGHDGDSLFYIHSFAWAGSSGSGVFNSEGRLIGYILAINVGSTEYGFDVLEDVVIVVPLFNIDWELMP